MLKFEENLASRVSGALQPMLGVQVTVTASNGLLATIYADDESTVLGNPLSTDANGYFGFKAANGEYTLTFAGAQIESATRKIELYDADDDPPLTLAQAAVPTAASRIGYQSNGSDASPRTVENKLGESVSVLDYGAKGDGVTDDTAAIQAAINSMDAFGQVVFPPGTYVIKAPIWIAANIILEGHGPKASVVKPSGAFDVFTFTGSCEGAGVRNIGFAASGMTGGALLVFSNSHRGAVRNVIATSPYNGILTTKVNVLWLREIWINGVRGEFGVKCYGDATNRSDVIDIDNVILSCADNAVGATGILIDGNVHTVDIRHAACTKMGRGLWVKNTAGALNPAFITAYDLQVDFPLNEGIRLEGSARSILLTDVYTHGSIQADGIYIDESVQNVSIQGGQCDSHFKRGVFAAGRYIKISNVQVCNNSAQGSAAWPGIEIGAASHGVIVVGCLSGQWLGYAANNQSYGIQISAGAQSYVVSANNLRYNVTGEVLDAASAVDSIVAGNATALGKYPFSRGICSYAGDLPMSAQGVGRLVLANGNGTHLEVGGVTLNVVNRLRISGDAAGGVPKLIAEGSDQNLDILLQTKGAGVPRFGTHSANSDTAITGYITIKDANGTLRKLAVIS